MQKKTSRIHMVAESDLSLSTIMNLARDREIRFHLSDKVRGRIRSQRAVVESVLSSDRSIYSINTGFGFLADVRIPKDKLKALQDNLIRSHACGVGEALPSDLVRGILIAKSHALALGHSGVRVECIEAILEFLNQNINPWIPVQGSVGASGDLAPLAHIALALIGEGFVLEGDPSVGLRKRKTSEVLKEKRIKALDLAPKEGLALINGTQFMSALGSWAAREAEILAKSADVVGALSLDAIRGTLVAFDKRIHDVRKQEGQRLVATNIRALFASGRDEVMESHKDCRKVQDAYSFRCIPQVHGASRDAIAYASRVIEADLNSVSDNPLVFEDGSILSGGNFHGQPLALACDFLAIATSEIGSISERRTEKLTNPNMSGLPAFLVGDSGINSGFMIPHVVAAALVSENKTLSHPASVDSIPTSADKEDHVSMGAFSARKALMITKNVSRILAIELIAACQGLDLLKPLKSNPVLESVKEHVRTLVPFMEHDQSLAEGIESLADWLVRGSLLDVVEKQGVEII